MKSDRKRGGQIFLGLLSSVALWLLGVLMSGSLSFVEHIEFYSTGYLVIAFPIVFAVVCILIAKLAAKKHMKTYYVSFMICLFVPIVCIIFVFLLGLLMELNMPIVSRVADVLQLIFTFPCIAPLTVYYSFLFLIGDGAVRIVLLSLAFLSPIIAGVLISVRIYKNGFKVKREKP